MNVAGFKMPMTVKTKKTRHQSVKKVHVKKAVKPTKMQQRKHVISFYVSFFTSTL